MSRLGSGWMVVAALCFALMSLFAAQGSSTLPAPEVLFYRTFIGLLVLLPLMASDVEGGSYATVLLADIFVAALFASSLHFILGPGGMHSFGHAAYFGLSSLSFALCCVLLRRERLPPAVWFALSLGFVGIACMLRPTFDAGQWFAGLMGLGSGLGAGLALFHVRELGELGERPSVTVFWLFFLSSLFGLLVVLFNGGFHALNGVQLAQMLAVGLMGLAGQLAMTRAYKEGRKFVVSSLAYLTVAFSALMGLFLHQQLLPCCPGWAWR